MAGVVRRLGPVVPFDQFMHVRDTDQREVMLEGETVRIWIVVITVGNLDAM